MSVPTLSLRQQLERLAQEIAQHEDQARRTSREAIAHKIAVGRGLIQAKGILPKGEFIGWATRTFGWTRQHVARHMLLAKHAARVLQAAGPDGSMAAALRACNTHVPSERWVLVGVLDVAPGETLDPAALVGSVKEWRLRRG